MCPTNMTSGGRSHIDQFAHALVPSALQVNPLWCVQPQGTFLQPPSTQMLYLFTPIPLIPQLIFTPFPLLFPSHNRKLHPSFVYCLFHSLKASGNSQSRNVSTFQPQECLNNKIGWIPFKPYARRNDKGSYHARKERQKGWGCQ